MQKHLLALLLVLPVLAGCIDDGGNGGDGNDEPPTGNGSNVGTNDAFELPIHFSEVDPDHDHGDASQHDIVNNFTLEAFLPLGADGGAAPGGISEIDVAGDHLYIGVMDYGFIIVDISDPLDPQITASVELTSTDNLAPPDVPLTLPYMADLKVDATGDWIFVATELSTNPGVHIYDARDRSNPVLAGFWPNPGQLLGCHMIEYAVIDGQEYLFCAPLDDAVYVGLIQPETPLPVREIAYLNRWTPTGLEFIQRDVDGILNSPPTGYHSVGGHHDMTWQQDPLTGDHVLSVSLWSLGWFWLDVNTPAVPTELGSWFGEGSPDWGGNMHTAMLFEDDGRRIAVGIPEVAVPPVVHTLDVSDYSAPEVLAHWNAVDDWHGEDGRYSTHNFQVVDQVMYMTHYHAGLFALDLSTPEDPVVAGTFMPFDRTEETYGRGCCGGSWDVVVWKGYVYVANTGGLYVTHLNGEPIDDDYSGFA